MILAADIGGTKVAAALYESTSNGVRRCAETSIASGEHTSLESALSEFLAAHRGGAITAACFSVAGPVIDGEAKITNLPWVLRESSLATALDIGRVVLLNDVEATGLGVLCLPPEQLGVLNPGQLRQGTAAVLAVGTGLGEGFLYWDGQRHHPVASEGGHCDFAPRTDVEIELLQHLRRQYRHVSYERVLSGPGIGNIYAFLRRRSGVPEPEWLAADLARDDAGAVVGTQALKGADTVCVAAMELFCAVLGAEAGNLALKAMTIGGVFLAGGIPPKILPLLRRDPFMQAFTDKGRFADVLRGIRVSVALDPRTALLGAAQHAATL
jgi:glucokinase